MSPVPVIFPLIPYLLVLTGFLCAINFYLGYRHNKKDLFGRILNSFTVFVFIHSFYVWIIEQFLPDKPWLDRMMPFVFVYGPFLYFALCALKGYGLTRRRIFAHLIPFFVFLLVFLITAYNGWNNDPFVYKSIMRVQGIFSICSLVSYTLYGIFSPGSKMVVNMKGKRVIVLLGGMMLLFISVFFFAILISKHTLAKNIQAVYMLRVTIYLCMLIITLLVLGYLKNNVLVTHEQDLVLRPLNEGYGQGNAEPPYKKSKLTEEQLSAYQIMLEEVIFKDKLFLDPVLSLDRLSAKTKVPAHHITQVFSVRLKTSFTNYVNELRINHACKLMGKGNEKRTIEQLAAESGFNSKISFNRNFKSFKGCTPSEYRG